MSLGLGIKGSKDYVLYLFEDDGCRELLGMKEKEEDEFGFDDVEK